MAYERRIIDGILDDVFPDLAAIALEGAKGVGKTATGMRRATTVIDLSVDAQRETLSGNVAMIATMAPPVFVDEWQLEPEVWNTVKRAVDADRSGSRFLLAGSAGIAPGIRIHSGAGRIVRLAMRPLSFAERGHQAPTVSLRDLLSGARPEIDGRTSVDLSVYIDEILRSGFPGIRDLPARVRGLQLDSYVARIADRELPENGVVVRRPAALTAWLRAYGAATATDTSYTKILDAATAGMDDKPAAATILAYREHLTRLFILDSIPAWIPVFSPLKRLTQSPKHHLVDPALAARLVGVDAAGLFRGEGARVGGAAGTWLGALFESLAAQSVRVYAEAAEGSVAHLRTRDTEREIDLIVEGAGLGVLAIEVKLSATVSDHDVRHLNWLEERIGDRVADKIIITTGEFAYRRPDGVGVVPLALLGP
jgi:predicted AAA+ superfamily ATPase